MAFIGIEQQMIKRKYKSFEPNGITAPSAIAAFQKKIKNHKGTKYVITCHKYDLKETRTGGYSYSFSGQMRLWDDSTFNFETVGWYFSPNKWHNPVKTIKDVELFFEDIWNRLNCLYYEKEWDEDKENLISKLHLNY